MYTIRRKITMEEIISKANEDFQNQYLMMMFEVENITMKTIQLLNAIL